MTHVSNTMSMTTPEQTAQSMTTSSPNTKISTTAISTTQTSTTTLPTTQSTKTSTQTTNLVSTSSTSLQATTRILTTLVSTTSAPNVISSTLLITKSPLSASTNQHKSSSTISNLTRRTTKAGLTFSPTPIQTMRPTKARSTISLRPFPTMIPTKTSTTPIPTVRSTKATPTTIQGTREKSNDTTFPVLTSQIENNQGGPLRHDCAVPTSTCPAVPMVRKHISGNSRIKHVGFLAGKLLEFIYENIFSNVVSQVPSLNGIDYPKNFRVDCIKSKSRHHHK
ncbi:unnamed protein product [Mytilus coruscus]|uniref:Uncharacterized protein n=1 Tax=Mytilus coruscus TaxID=42192 RepID=A0A6J8DFJ6_MYTCO|nr:unnamed protein product [Mytilus coruscus]